jgi:hypothetical protein
MWRAAAAEQPGRARGVVRGPEGSLGPQRTRLRAQDPVDLGHLQRLIEAHRRQEAGQAPCQHRLAGTRSAAQQQSVCAGRGDLQGPLRALLAAHFGQVGCRRRGVRHARGLGGQGRRTVEVADHRTQVRGAVHAQARRQGGLARVPGRHDEPAAARVAQRHRHRESTAHRPQAPVQGELSDQREAIQGCRLHRARCGQHGHRDGEVEPGPALAELGGCQIDGDASIRELLAERGDGGAHACRALPHRGFGQTHDVDARQLRADAHLHLDRNPVDAVQRRTQDSRGHGRLPRDRRWVERGGGSRGQGEAGPRRDEVLPSTLEKPRQKGAHCTVSGATDREVSLPRQLSAAAVCRGPGVTTAAAVR